MLFSKIAKGTGNLFILAAGMVFSIILAGVVIWSDITGSQEDFIKAANEYSELVLTRLNNNVSVINGVRAVGHTIDDMDSEQFSIFSSEVMRKSPQIQSVEYLVRVKRGNLGRFEAAMRNSGYANYRIRQNADVSKGGSRWKPVSRRDSYYPVKYIEPFEPIYVQRLGFDMYSDPLLKNAIYGAIISGNAIASDPHKLVTGRRGYILFRALYAGIERPATIAERKKTAARMVAVSVDTEKLMSGYKRFPLISRVSMIPVAVKQGTGKAENALYEYRKNYSLATSLLFPRFTFQKDIISSGQVFTLFLEGQSSLDVLRLNVLAVVVFSSFLITAMLMYIIRIRASGRKEHSLVTEALHQERERAAVTLYSIADAVITTNERLEVDFMNPVAERMTEWRPGQAKGVAVDLLFKLYDDTSKQRIDIPAQECIRKNKVIKLEDSVILKNKGGNRMPVSLSVAPIRNHRGEVTGTVMALQDVSQSREMARRLTHQATHDSLTGLVNRREFERRLQKALTTKSIDMWRIVLYLDLDRFKVVNDTCGHVAGDAMLRQIAGLLRPLVSGRETLARLGGDEFGLLLEDCSREAAQDIAGEIIELVKKFRFAWEDKTFEIGVSIGMVVIGEDAITLADAMSFADSACYVAKDKGGNRLHVYQSDDDDLVKRHGEMQWVHRITHAHEESRFILYGQEIVPLGGKPNPVRHYEVLVRMIGEHGDIIPPTTFIQAAERYQMMKGIDRWIISHAFAMIVEYNLKRETDPALERVDFSINLSGQTISDNDSLEFIRSALNDNPGLASSIVFEITETVAVLNMTEAATFISIFKKMGCRFALDDFGTGVSSFSYLKNLNVDYLKIDGEFVKDVACDPVDFAMVSSINHMGHVIGVETVAEYVESESICERLKEMGVDYGQGHWLDMPAPLEHLLFPERETENPVTDIL